MWVDHRNHNKLDNRRENIRIATPAQNLANSKARGTSGFKGVSVTSDVKGKPYQAKIKSNGKTQYLGHFSTPEEAHEAYCVAATKAHGEFARFN